MRVKLFSRSYKKEKMDSLVVIWEGLTAVVMSNTIFRIHKKTAPYMETIIRETKNFITSYDRRAPLLSSFDKRTHIVNESLFTMESDC